MGHLFERGVYLTFLGVKAIHAKEKSERGISKDTLLMYGGICMTKFITCKLIDPSLQNTIPSFQFTWSLLEIFDSSSSNTSIRDVEFMTLQVISYHSSIRHHRLVIIHRVCIVYESCTSCMYHVLIVDSSSRNTSIRHSSSRLISSILHINTSNHHHRLVIIHRVCIVHDELMDDINRLEE